MTRLAVIRNGASGGPLRATLRVSPEIMGALRQGQVLSVRYGKRGAQRAVFIGWSRRGQLRVRKYLARSNVWTAARPVGSVDVLKVWDRTLGDNQLKTLESRV